MGTASWIDLVVLRCIVTYFTLIQIVSTLLGMTVAARGIL